MITSAFVYNGVNLILAIACLVSAVLVFKYVPDRRGRLLLVLAFVLIILSSGILSFCLRIAKLYEAAFIGEMFHKAPEGSFDKVNFYKFTLSRLGNVLDLIGIGIIVGVSKRLISLRGTGTKEKDVAA
ncbi:MAG: hypothetical protein Kow0099_26320 [Candidatus Abyssubacteria bacterium]